LQCALFVSWSMCRHPHLISQVERSFLGMANFCSSLILLFFRDGSNSHRFAQKLIKPTNLNVVCGVSGHWFTSSNSSRQHRSCVISIRPSERQFILMPVKMQWKRFSCNGRVARLALGRWHLCHASSLGLNTKMVLAVFRH